MAFLQVKYKPPLPDNMKWYKVYRILLCFIVFLNIAGFATDNVFQKIILAIQLIITVYLIIRMPNFTKTVYKVHQIYLCTLIIFYSVVIIYHTVNSFFFGAEKDFLYSSLVLGGSRVIFHILNMIYFKKRKHMFIYP